MPWSCFSEFGKILAVKGKHGRQNRSFVFHSDADALIGLLNMP